MGNQDSWKKSAADRRDDRNTKSSDQPKPIAAKKNTKRWCKGKEGVEHILVAITYNDLHKAVVPNTVFNTDWWVRYCSTCGKEIAHYFPFGNSKPKPDWVPK